MGENRNHNLRFSVQQGFRNPTTQDFFIGLNVGNAVLVGSAPTNLDRDVRTFDLNPTGSGAAVTGSTTATVVGRQAYENAFLLSSVNAGAPEAVNTPVIKPEGITAYEMGYRAQLGKVSIDLSAYYNQYKDFVALRTVLVPFYGEAGDNSLSLLALQNGDFFPYQVYTNAEEDVNSYGGTFGIDTKIFGNFDLGANYTYAKLDVNESAIQASNLRLNFNTPEHKVKVSFGNRELFKNFGFGLNWRWSDSYFWEASFADGEIDAFSVLDAQFNYTVPSMNSVFKIGGSNILNEEYVTAFGTGNIGAIYYVSWTINP